MAETTINALFTKPAEVAVGRVTLMPDGPQPYKVVFQMGDLLLSEHPVATVREGEALIRRELPGIRFSAQQERPNPEAPARRLSAVGDTATD